MGHLKPCHTKKYLSGASLNIPSLTDSQNTISTSDPAIFGTVLEVIQSLQNENDVLLTLVQLRTDPQLSNKQLRKFTRPDNTPKSPQRNYPTPTPTSHIDIYTDGACGSTIDHIHEDELPNKQVRGT